jgi:hypothetical protein
MLYETFRKTHPATRYFQEYDQATRGHIRNVPRSGKAAQRAEGRFFYVHPMVPGLAFRTAQAATTRAYAVFCAAARVAESIIDRLRVAEPEASHVEAEAEAAEVEALGARRGRVAT